MSEPSEILRRSAKVLREHAVAASRGPWIPLWDDIEQFGSVMSGPSGTQAEHQVAACAPVFTSRAGDNADYIALMDPTVGLALADWLDAEATHSDRVSWPPTPKAKAVARAILRAEAPDA